VKTDDYSRGKAPAASFARSAEKFYLAHPYAALIDAKPWLRDLPLITLPNAEKAKPHH